MAEHTRLPWAVASSDTAMVVHRFEPSDPASGGIIVHTAPKKGSLLVSRSEAEANAAFIVKAVNAHDDLVAAIGNVLQHRQGTFPNGYLRDNDTTRAALQRLADALAKAEG